MLKSIFTQFAATLFFGPLGLAYSSMAAAVFLTLILAVLFFTGLGVIAAVVVWPIAIIAGLAFVKMHNDQIRSSGSKLLLGPDEEESIVSAIGSWGRGVAVLGVIGLIGFIAFSHNSGKISAFDNLVNGGDSDKTAEMADATTLDSGTIDPNAVIVSSSSTSSDNIFSVVSIDQQNIEPVITGTSSQPEVISGGADDNYNIVDSSLHYVDSEMVNLREGPGTNFSILTQVARGEELTEIDRAGNWLHVSSTNSGSTGWILNRLVRSQP